MANNTALNPIRIDTSGAATTSVIVISKIRWVGATTAGHAATIQDANGNTFWTSLCPGSNYVEESDFTTTNLNHRTMNGITASALDSGVLYIYS